MQREQYAVDLMLRIAAAGVSINVKTGDKIALSPAHRVTAGMRARVRQFKPEILNLVAEYERHLLAGGVRDLTE